MAHIIIFIAACSHKAHEYINNSWALTHTYTKDIPGNRNNYSTGTTKMTRGMQSSILVLIGSLSFTACEVRHYLSFLTNYKTQDVNLFYQLLIGSETVNNN